MSHPMGLGWLCEDRKRGSLRYGLVLGFQHGFGVSHLIVQIRHLGLATVSRNVDTAQPHLGPPFPT